MRRIRVSDGSSVTVRCGDHELEVVALDVARERRGHVKLGFVSQDGAFTVGKVCDNPMRASRATRAMIWCEENKAAVDFSPGSVVVTTRLGGFAGPRFLDAVETAMAWHRHCLGPGVSFEEIGPDTEISGVSDVPGYPRLAFDVQVDPRWPVVKGTWVTVSQVVSKLEEGESWPEILRVFPELAEGDIHECLRYYVDEPSRVAQASR